MPTLKLTPDADTLLAVLDESLRRESMSKDSAVDRWFRAPCTAEVICANGTAILQDDLGYFFQKWMLLVRQRGNEESIYFMGGSVCFRGEDVVLTNRSGDVIMSSVEFRELLGEIASELERQLSAVAGADAKCEAEIRHYIEEYLRSLRTFSTST